MSEVPRSVLIELINYHYCMPILCVREKNQLPDFMYSFETRYFYEESLSADKELYKLCHQI